MGIPHNIEMDYVGDIQYGAALAARLQNVDQILFLRFSDFLFFFFVFFPSFSLLFRFQFLGSSLIFSPVVGSASTL